MSWWRLLIVPAMFVMRRDFRFQSEWKRLLQRKPTRSSWFASLSTKTASAQSVHSSVWQTPSDLQPLPRPRLLQLHRTGHDRLPLEKGFRRSGLIYLEFDAMCEHHMRYSGSGHTNILLGCLQKNLPGHRCETWQVSESGSCWVPSRSLGCMTVRLKSSNDNIVWCLFHWMSHLANFKC